MAKKLNPLVKPSAARNTLLTAMLAALLAVLATPVHATTSIYYTMGDATTANAVGVTVYNPGTSAITSTNNTFISNSPTTVFGSPYGIAVDQAGNVYVGDLNQNIDFHSGGFNGNIGKYTASTGIYDPKFVYFFSQVHNPWALLLNGNTLLASEHTYNVVNTYNSTTGAVIAQPLINSTNIDYAIGMAQDSSGNIYIANYGGGTVAKFDASGNFLSNIITTTHPAGVAVVGSDLYVTNYDANTISKYDLSGNLTPGEGTWATTGSHPIALISDGTNLFSANYGGGTITEYSLATGSEILQPGGGHFLSGLGHPIGLAILSVPEPSSVALLCICGGAFVAWRVRRRQPLA
ncbi:MAG: SMP-30/gluconolactonase/LRE family protein [Chthoniobacterales bacterium]